MSGKNDFFAAAELIQGETATVEVPGFGPLKVRGLSGAEYARFEAASTVKAADGKETYQADRGLLVRLAAVGDGGGEFFTDDDLPRLREIPHKVLRPIVQAAFKLSGVGEDAEGN